MPYVIVICHIWDVWESICHLYSLWLEAKQNSRPQKNKKQVHTNSYKMYRGALLQIERSAYSSSITQRLFQKVSGFVGAYTYSTIALRATRVESQPTDLSQSQSTLSLTLHFLSSYCPIAINKKNKKFLKKKQSQPLPLFNFCEIQLFLWESTWSRIFPYADLLWVKVG